MGSTICKNELCAATTSHEWKKGWPLRSGGFAKLCFNCGSAFEKSVYCETFHSEETGWRDCSTCGKKIHCGCVVSKSMYDFLDHGGVGCNSCGSRSLVFSNNEAQKRLSGPSDVGSSQSPLFPNRVVGGCIDEVGLMQLCEAMENNEPNVVPRLQRSDLNESLGQIVKLHETSPEKMGDVGREFSIVAPSSVGSLSFPNPENSRIMSLGIEDRHESLAEPSLKMTLGTPSRTSNLVLALSNGVGGGDGGARDPGKTPPSLSFEPQRNRPILPKPLKSGLGGSSEPNKGLNSPMRIARPPGEGRGKSQLLPRYWPRITDQELEKLSGDLNSTIVPLFEKVLSASDAGRIGRLVLPKACAEAYFPAIAQSEGLPLKVQDVKGNEWTFQFRFWPNNNSRMYVLEGVTPCIQALQLQAGDTVTFSRIDPGGKLMMGYRKASNNGELQDADSYAQSNGFIGESSSGNGSEYPPNGNGYPGAHHHAKTGSKDPLLANGNTGLHRSETNGFRNGGDGDHSLQKPPEKKKTRNIGSKSKRLLMHSEDVLELRLTWEEAQDLLRPPPTANLNIVTIEDHEFEEYDAPPVFGKRTLFVSRSTGGQEQWAQCDECSKWRKLPVDVLLPSKWACSENEWDVSRGFCSAPEELSLKELENLLRSSRDKKKRRTTEERKLSTREGEEGRGESGLEALASAAALGSGGGGEAMTTRHPRHRPGCSCIVCIQPPSGKGKHKSTCTCNVCMTVKRRFKTLMLRKKRRLTNANANNAIANANEIGGGGIDLNSHPTREEEPPEQQRRPGFDATTPLAGERNLEEVVMEKVCDDGVPKNRISGVFIDPSLD